MTDMACSTCRWSRPVPTLRGDAVAYLECRGNPPQIYNEQDLFPCVRGDWWCRLWEKMG